MKPLDIESPLKADSVLKRGQTLITNEIEQVFPTSNQSIKKWVIQPNHPMKIIWNGLTAIFLCVDIVVLPLHLAFDTDDNSDIFWLFEATNLIWAVDMILNFFTAYKDSYTHKLVTSRKQIAVHYLTGWFAVDLIALMPVWVVTTESVQITSVLRVYRLSRFVRFLRLVSLVRVYKKISKAARKSKKIEPSQFQDLKVQSGQFRVLSFILYLTVYFHVSACLFILIGK